MTLGCKAMVVYSFFIYIMVVQIKVRLFLVKSIHTVLLFTCMSGYRVTENIVKRLVCLK